MDGENNRKPYEQMGDLGGNTPIFGSTPISLHFLRGKSVPKFYDKFHEIASAKDYIIRFPTQKRLCTGNNRVGDFINDLCFDV